MKKLMIIIFLFLIIFSLGVFILVWAQSPSPAICGDGVVQSPNDEDPPKYEKCDEGDSNGTIDSSCTVECGQKMLGWAWADNFGWLSLNRDNCKKDSSGNYLYLDPKLPLDICKWPQTIPYYVQVTADNEVRGWAWSDNIGWVCFGEGGSDINKGCSGWPPFGSLKATLVFDDPEKPQVMGWAQATALGDEGWLSLNCKNEYPQTCPLEYQVRLILGNFNGEPRYTLIDWAWNKNNSGNGLGWLNFSAVTEVLPWLQTQYGDIYARRGIIGQNEPPSFNATYRILASGTIVNFYSARGLEYIDPDFGPIDFPTPQTRYSNVLGQLDVDSLLCEGVTKDNSDETCINQQGKTVVSLNKRIELPPCSRQPCVDNPLAGKIYYHKGDLTISNNFDFLNGSGFASGAGTIIIDGNLIVAADNITYDNSNSLTKFRNLASVAWIVRGDLLIQGNVNQLAGNFIIIGDGENDCDPDSEVPGCGQIYSCYNLANCQNRLTVLGLMMARKFYLDREFPPEDPLKGQKGSEVIIYDGRLLANIPPGLGDLAKSLPIWRSGIFTY